MSSFAGQYPVSNERWKHSWLITDYVTVGVIWEKIENIENLNESVVSVQSLPQCPGFDERDGEGQ